MAVLKKETDYELENNCVKISILKNYKLVWDILNLPTVKSLALAMSTSRVYYC